MPESILDIGGKGAFLGHIYEKKNFKTKDTRLGAIIPLVKVLE